MSVDGKAEFSLLRKKILAYDHYFDEPFCWFYLFVVYLTRRSQYIWLNRRAQKQKWSLFLQRKYCKIERTELSNCFYTHI
jgi:hypothetical protein